MTMQQNAETKTHRGKNTNGQKHNFKVYTDMIKRIHKFISTTRG